MTGITAGETSSPVRALIVDDEPLARAHLKSLLRERGDVDVIGESGDGRSAIDPVRVAQWFNFANCFSGVWRRC